MWIWVIWAEGECEAILKHAAMRTWFSKMLKMSVRTRAMWSTHSLSTHGMLPGSAAFHVLTLLEALQTSVLLRPCFLAWGTTFLAGLQLTALNLPKGLSSVQEQNSWTELAEWETVFQTDGLNALPRVCVCVCVVFKRFWKIFWIFSIHFNSNLKIVYWSRGKLDVVGTHLSKELL